MGFVGIVLKFLRRETVNNNQSGPDGVTSHGGWVYGGDGDSTLKVFNLNSIRPTRTATYITPAQTISTGGTTRVDEMALTPDGKLLLAANNAEDPPFATLFTANGNSGVSNVSIITKITVDPTIIPPGFGLSLEQPTWEPKTKRFYNSIPIIANNPAGCNYGQLTGAITCDGGMLVIDPTTLSKPNGRVGCIRPKYKHRRRAAKRLQSQRRHGRTRFQSAARLHARQQPERHDHPRDQRDQQKLLAHSRHYRLRRSLVQFRRPALLHRFERQ